MSRSHGIRSTTTAALITAYNVIRWSAPPRVGSSTRSQTTATTHTFTGLTIGTYYYTIEATNAAGTGPRSAPRTTAIVDDSVAGRSVGISTSVDDAAMTMAWFSGDAGTSPITGHLVQYSTDDITWTTVSSGLG